MPLPRLTPRERRALLLAPLVAPLAHGVGLAVFGAVRALTLGQSVRLVPPPLVLGVLFGIGAPIAYGAMGLLGLPVYLALRRARRVARLPLWSAGGIIGAAVAIVLRPSLRGELFSIPFPVWEGILIGLVTAEVFLWLLRDSGERPPDAGAAE